MTRSQLKRIGKYEITEVLGRGGMGVVYKAVDPAIGRAVAIKMITGAFADDPDLLKRFYREAQSTGSLQHPNIVTIYELGDLDRTPYLVMEFLEGEGLDKIIATKRPMTLVEKLSLVVQICSGLGYAHQHNIVHRDIKPANIMVLSNGVVKIVDFGIARIGNGGLTRPGQVVGSIHYMSHEQINAASVDARTDIFSTGVVLFQLLTYRLPFEGKDTGATLLKILNDPAPPLSAFAPGLPDELEEIVQRALAKDREERYQTADDMSCDVCQVLDRLKAQEIKAHIGRAEEHFKNAEWNPAREQIAEALKLERQSSRANMLNREIHAAIRREQREQQARQYQVLVRRALGQHEYDEALGVLDHALASDKGNAEIMRLRETLQQAKSRTEHVHDALRRAREAHAAGELEEASLEISEILQLEPQNSEAKVLHAEVQRTRDEIARRKQVAGYLEEARKYIALRRFTVALEALRRASELEPGTARTRELEQAAVAGQEQENRRKNIEALAAEIQEALHGDDYHSACHKAKAALEKYPDDTSLMKLKSLADRQREAGEKRLYVEERAGSARKLMEERRTAEAIAELQEALQKCPGEPSLQSLMVFASDLLERDRGEQKKAEYIRVAKDALHQRRFDEAIALLQAASAELQTREFDDLLQFARDEAAVHQRRTKVNSALQEAQELIAKEEYERAAQFIESALQEVPDDDLRLLLADAQRHIEEHSAAVREAVATATRLQRMDKFADAVRFLESQPLSFRRSGEFREALQRAHDRLARLQTINAIKEQVRTLLDEQNFAAAFLIIDACVKESGENNELILLRNEAMTRQQKAAAASVEKAMRDARLVLLVRSYNSAIDVLQNVSEQVPLLSPEMQSQYKALKADAVAGAERHQRLAAMRNTRASQWEIAGGPGTASSQQAGRMGAAAVTPVPLTPAPMTPPPLTPPMPLSPGRLTPTPEEWQQLETEMRRAKDLEDLREIYLLAKGGPAAPERDMLRDAARDLTEAYNHDFEFHTLLHEINTQLASPVANQEPVIHRRRSTDSSLAGFVVKGDNPAGNNSAPDPSALPARLTETPTASHDSFVAFVVDRSSPQQQDADQSVRARQELAAKITAAAERRINCEGHSGGAPRTKVNYFLTTGVAIAAGIFVAMTSLTLRTPEPPPAPRSPAAVVTVDPADSNAASSSQTSRDNTVDPIIRNNADRARRPSTADNGLEQKSIADALKIYEEAYANRDAKALSAVWPTMGASELKSIQSAFEQAISARAVLRATNTPQIHGERATVICSRFVHLIFRKKVEATTQDAVTIMLRKQNNSWVIESVQENAR